MFTEREQTVLVANEGLRIRRPDARDRWMFPLVPHRRFESVLLVGGGVYPEPTKDQETRTEMTIENPGISRRRLLTVQKILAN